MPARRGLGARLLALPLFLQIFAIACAMMLVPAVYAGLIRDHEVGRAFLYSGLLGLILSGLIGLAHLGRPARHGALGPLMSLFSAFTFLPLALAVPFYEGLGTTSFLNAYVEMVSAITTTGATMFEHGRLSPALHLWRGLVGWMGGLMMWVAAAAILAPLSLGGFEVTARAAPGRAEAAMGEVRARILRSGAALVPIYVGLTALLWLVLVISGERALPGVMHAMGVMATSGITSEGGLEFARAGWTGEALMALFMLFALSRLTFAQDTVLRGAGGQGGLRHDPEFRIGLALAFVVALALVLRHWIGANAMPGGDTVEAALGAFWGGLFTVLSFLTTTGYQSAWWGTAQSWSGLEAPGLILMGLALIGGGVATTAGGVKLLRVYALYLNGVREMERLVHPSSVGRQGTLGARVRREGAFIAWVFFMLFALSLAAITLVLAALGTPFEASVKLALAALTTTGPMLDITSLGEVRLVTLGAWSKAVFAAAMVLGRLETLAIIALMTPDLWRRGR